jgi:tRNA (guanine-N7-)-methyltransferase
MFKNRFYISRPELIWSEAELPRPLNPEDFFKCSAPFHLEIGCGTGHFIAGMCERNPDVNFLGVEVSLKYARISAWKLERRNVTNGVILHGDSRNVIAHLLPTSSVVACYIFYPDPWFKKRHAKRRIFEKDYLLDLVRVICPDGDLFVKTDVSAYHTRMLEAFTETPDFELLSDENLAGREPGPDDIITNFERKARLKGHPLHSMHFKRR